MRTTPVVGFHSCGDLKPDMGQAHEQRFVKQLIAQSTGAGSHRMSQIGPLAERLLLSEVVEKADMYLPTRLRTASESVIP